MSSDNTVNLQRVTSCVHLIRAQAIMQRFASFLAALLLLAPSAHLVAAHSGDDDGDGRSHHQSRRLRVVDTDIVDLEVSNADAITTGDTITITGR